MLDGAGTEVFRWRPCSGTRLLRRTDGGLILSLGTDRCRRSGHAAGTSAPLSHAGIASSLQGRAMRVLGCDSLHRASKGMEEPKEGHSWGQA